MSTLSGSEVGAGPAGRVVALRCFPVKAAGGESLAALEVTPSGVAGDREWAVYDQADKLASGKHTRRLRRMDEVFALVASRRGGDTVLVLPDGTEVVAGESGADTALSTHFREPVRLRREDAIPHQDAAPVSVVGTATLAELGRHEGDGRPLDPRHLRTNIVVETQEPYVEESWVGHEVSIGGVRLRVTDRTERCRMVGVAQVDLPPRPGMLKVVSVHHDLRAGVYAEVVAPGRIALGDEAGLA
ncbi:MOSC domain-containing protein [Pedococcus sp. KACC 23699]|uniref:MOSC domain-containing protein n=1 Tax=Pedococcus sp. KACC 23699 TaxID=3149228 RepID=A0AAU7JVM1_9MICO